MSRSGRDSFRSHFRSRYTVAHFSWSSPSGRAHFRSEMGSSAYRSSGDNDNDRGSSSISPDGMGNGGGGGACAPFLPFPGATGGGGTSPGAGGRGGTSSGAITGLPSCGLTSHSPCGLRFHNRTAPSAPAEIATPFFHATARSLTPPACCPTTLVGVPAPASHRLIVPSRLAETANF